MMTKTAEWVDPYSDENMAGAEQIIREQYVDECEECGGKLLESGKGIFECEDCGSLYNEDGDWVDYDGNVVPKTAQFDDEPNCPDCGSYDIDTNPNPRTSFKCMECGAELNWDEVTDEGQLYDEFGDPEDRTANLSTPFVDAVRGMGTLVESGDGYEIWNTGAGFHKITITPEGEEWTQGTPEFAPKSYGTIEEARAEKWGTVTTSYIPRQETMLSSDTDWLIEAGRTAEADANRFNSEEEAKTLVASLSIEEIFDANATAKAARKHLTGLKKCGTRVRVATIDNDSTAYLKSAERYRRQAVQEILRRPHSKRAVECRVVPPDESLFA
jgi:DNA-directed RNA polymerase subunit RPC12/RpoP